MTKGSEYEQKLKAMLGLDRLGSDKKITKNQIETVFATSDLRNAVENMNQENKIIFGDLRDKVANFNI